MLGKLIKHEFKSTSKILICINLIIILISTIGCLTFVSPMWNLDSIYIPFLAMSSAIVYYIVLIAASFFVMLYLSIRFFRNLYTDEGYLMHTLPVTSHQLVLSKLIPSFIWILITFCFIALSIFSICASALMKFASPLDVQALFRELPLFFEELYGMTPAGFMGYVAVSFIVSGVFIPLQSYAAISLGQLFTKFKVLASVGCYVGLCFILQIISLIVTIPNMMKITMANIYDNSAISMGGFMSYTLASSIVMTVILSIVYYFLSVHLMNKKLNLD